jgi:DNA-binding transcriptional regulator YdaS (Cro superfamily)
MNLREYLSRSNRSASDLADVLKVSPAQLSQWRTGYRVPDSRSCVAIEQATNGQVRRWDLRPCDWRDIWPELADHPNAPAGGSKREAQAA